MQVLLWFLNHLIIGGYFMVVIWISWRQLCQVNERQKNQPLQIKNLLVDDMIGAIWVLLIFIHLLVAITAWKSVIVALAVYGLYKKGPIILTLIKEKLKRTAS